MIRRLLRKLRALVARPRRDVEDEFFDLDLAITASSTRADGSRVFELSSVRQGQTIGVNVVVLPEWQPDKLGGQIPVFWGRVAYESVGEPSDQLLRVLAAGYRRAVPRVGMVQRIDFAAVSLSGDPLNLPNEAVKMKLFFEADGERYAEVYTNLDPGNAVGEIHEKDFGYRDSFLAALQSSSA